MGLREYHRKRDFTITPEPRGVDPDPADAKAEAKTRSFVIQKHAASHLHYDFRLELEGVLKSWSVPKGPSLDPKVKRLAMATEDHPIEYGGFEGIIPEGEYGGGTVLLWDRGTWVPVGNPHEGYHKGSLKFELRGEKLHGLWALVRIKGRDGKRGEERSWLLIKERDGEARADVDITERAPNSVASGRGLAEIAAEKDRVWHSNRPMEEAPAARRRAAPAAKAKPVAIDAPAAAPKAALPAFVEPQLATLVRAAPAGDEWLHEMKFDGYRILARRSGGEVQLYTRTGQDWTARFATVAAAVARLPGERLLIDGEIAVVKPDGTTSFQALQNFLSAGANATLAYFVFDLLHLDGRDLRPLPLRERKRLLAQLTRQANGARGLIRFADHVEGDGPAFFAQAEKMGLEGILSKRADRPYHSGRSPDWVKTKCTKRQELVIGGFTPPQGARQGLGALLVGFHEDGGLRYAGKVGTGFTQKSVSELRARLGKLEQKTSPFSPAPRPTPKAVHWVAPKLVAEIAFTEMTADGKLRHPSFLGLREDKKPTDVVREAPAPAPTDAKSKTASKPAATGDTVAGVKLSNPQRVLYPDLGLTKRDLAAYYEAVGDRMLPGLRDRPLSLVRCPEGLPHECFYMKHAMRGTAATLRRVNIKERSKTAEYLIADGLDGIIGLVQMSVLEIHTWNSTATALETPDRVVFDLDPGPKVAWPDVIKGARAIRGRLSALGFDSFVKTTGGKGLHVVLPLVAENDWETCFEFTRLVSENLVAENPRLYTTEMAKAGREDKILIDHFRNQRGATSVAAYSTRARAGAPVSVPLAWDELDEFAPERPYTVQTLPARLATGADPWRDYDSKRRRLADAIPDLAPSPPRKRERAAAPRRRSK